MVENGSEASATRKAPHMRLWLIAVFTLALIVLSAFRFARIDLAGTSFFATDNYYTWTSDDGRHIDHLNIDIAQYLSMVEDFRGVPDAFKKQDPYPDFEATGGAHEGPVEPFTHRVGLPWLASLLPMDSSYAFAFVNVAFLVAGLWFLVDAMAATGRSPTAQMVGAALYTFALPVVVFGSSLFLDGGVVGVLMIGYWLLARRAWWAVVMFIPVSYLVKEALLILVFPAVWAWRTSGHSFKDRRFIAGSALCIAGIVAVALWVSARAPEPVFSFTVLPTWGFLRWNLTNPTSAVFFVVGVSTVVIPAILGIRLLLRTTGWPTMIRGSAGSDIIGFAAVTALNAYSIVSTDLTLRTAWLVWPFAIALAGIWVDQGSDLPERLDKIASPARVS